MVYSTFNFRSKLANTARLAQLILDTLAAIFAWAAAPVMTMMIEALGILLFLSRWNCKSDPLGSDH